MAKMTLEDLRKLRDEKKKALSKRDPENKEVQIVIGMGTCGIAAGAKDTFHAILDELEAKGVTNVLVRQTGCMGLCHSEPTVEVLVPNMPTVIYGNVDGTTAKKIINDHVVNKTLVENLICDKPAVDILS